MPKQLSRKNKQKGGGWITTPTDRRSFKEAFLGLLKDNIQNGKSVEDMKYSLRNIENEARNLEQIPLRDQQYFFWKTEVELTNREIPNCLDTDHKGFNRYVSNLRWLSKNTSHVSEQVRIKARSLLQNLCPGGEKLIDSKLVDRISAIKDIRYKIDNVQRLQSLLVELRKINEPALILDSKSRTTYFFTEEEKKQFVEFFKEKQVNCHEIPETKLVTLFVSYLAALEDLHGVFAHYYRSGNTVSDTAYTYLLPILYHWPTTLCGSNANVYERYSLQRRKYLDTQLLSSDREEKLNVTNGLGDLEKMIESVLPKIQNLLNLNMRFYRSIGRDLKELFADLKTRTKYLLKDSEIELINQEFHNSGASCYNWDETVKGSFQLQTYKTNLLFIAGEIKFFHEMKDQSGVFEDRLRKHAEGLCIPIAAANITAEADIPDALSIYDPRVNTTTVGAETGFVDREGRPIRVDDDVEVPAFVDAGVATVFKMPKAERLGGRKNKSIRRDSKHGKRKSFRKCR